MVQNYVSPCEKAYDATNLISIFPLSCSSCGTYVTSKVKNKCRNIDVFLLMYLFTIVHDISHTFKGVYLLFWNKINCILFFPLGSPILFNLFIFPCKCNLNYVGYGEIILMQIVIFAIQIEGIWKSRIQTNITKPNMFIIKHWFEVHVCWCKILKSPLSWQSWVLMRNVFRFRFYLYFCSSSVGV